jgi:hypothetical protein
VNDSPSVSANYDHRIDGYVMTLSSGQRGDAGRLVTYPQAHFSTQVVGYVEEATRRHRHVPVIAQQNEVGPLCHPGGLYRSIQAPDLAIDVDRRRAVLA